HGKTSPVKESGQALWLTNRLHQLASKGCLFSAQALHPLE
ncbi:MAG: hypothetical protein ACI9C9_002935, partial [Marivirga sp.]